jgi:hypothetical protein
MTTIVDHDSYIAAAPEAFRSSLKSLRVAPNPRNAGSGGNGGVQHAGVQDRRLDRRKLCGVQQAVRTIFPAGWRRHRVGTPPQELPLRETQIDHIGA